jgi:hypothetical protein
LRQSQGNPGAPGVVYHFPVPDGSGQYAPFTRVTADKISESPQPQAFIAASRLGIKPHKISHNAKQVRFADDQPPPSTKNPIPVKETRIESVARETQKPIVQHGVKQYRHPSSKGPTRSRVSKLSMSERRGSKSSSEYSLPAEPINGGKKLGARAFANLNHAALRGDDEELLPTPGRRHKTPSLSPEVREILFIMSDLLFDLLWHFILYLFVYFAYLLIGQLLASHLQFETSTNNDLKTAVHNLLRSSLSGPLCS